jgi:cytochrome c553
MASEGRGALALLALALSLPLHAQAPARAEACVACHGAGGISRLSGQPSIAGQPKTFIENQLVLIREGLRDVPTMAPVVKGLSDEDITALARHFAALPPAPALAGKPEPARRQAGAELSTKLLCGTCHLPGYVGQNQVPRLSGQDEAYLLAAMKQFRDSPGPGRDTIMSGTLRGLTDAELGQLAHYLALVPPAAAR